MYEGSSNYTFLDCMQDLLGASSSIMQNEISHVRKMQYNISFYTTKMLRSTFGLRKCFKNLHFENNYTKSIKIE